MECGWNCSYSQACIEEYNHINHTNIRFLEETNMSTSIFRTLFYFKIHMEKYSDQYWALCSFVVTVLLCHCLSDCQPSKCVFDAGRSGPVGNHCMIKYWHYCTYSYMYCTYSCLEFFSSHYFCLQPTVYIQSYSMSFCSFNYLFSPLSFLKTLHTTALQQFLHHFTHYEYKLVSLWLSIYSTAQLKFSPLSDAMEWIVCMFVCVWCEVEGWGCQFLTAVIDLLVVLLSWLWGRQPLVSFCFALEMQLLTKLPH